MLAFAKDGGTIPKCYFTHSQLPVYIDPQHPPNKKKPFSTFNALPFAHTVDLILPSEIYELVQRKLYNLIHLRYARVYLTLGEILEGDFFSEYIKKGNIAMLSEGRPLIDNVFSLYNGVLRLELDKQTYERCGLAGVAIEDGGKKHKKARFKIEIDLKENCMRHGKKGFERLRWACKNVLHNSLTWLFYNFNPGSPETLEESQEPISAHHPFVCKVSPEATIGESLLVPRLRAEELELWHEQEDSLSLLEYFDLVLLDSPRIRANDSIDPLLSRYEVPDIQGDGSGIETKNMVKVRWRGFIPPAWIQEVFCLMNTAAFVGQKEKDLWFTLSVKGFEGWGGGYTVCQFKSRDTLTWKYD